jgi:uncharacterized protein (DUF433 family)
MGMDFLFIKCKILSKIKYSYLYHMEIQKVINIDQDILGGQPVFAGTRVPVESLFDHLEAGISLDGFLDDFPSVTKEQAVSLLDIANRLVTSKDIAKLYEAVA